MTFEIPSIGKFAQVRIRDKFTPPPLTYTVVAEGSSGLRLDPTQTLELGQQFKIRVFQINLQLIYL